MGIFNRFKQFILKDVKDENEARKNTIISRVFSLIMIGYFLVQSVVLLIEVSPKMGGVALLCMTGYIAAFAGTYMNRTKMNMIYIQAITLWWIVLYVYLMGWDCGVQTFMFVLLVYDALTMYTKKIIKILYVFFLGLVRLGLYAYTRALIPPIQLNLQNSAFFQVINTTFILAALTSIVIIFSEESLVMEKKLTTFNEKIRKMALVDPLTGLKNRRGAMEVLERCVTDYSNKGSFFCISIADIDFFKKVNDVYGHEAGDFVLVELSKLLKEEMKELGTVARWGGEEFLFIFENINGDFAYSKLEYIRHKIHHMDLEYKGEHISVSMTFGLEEYDSEGLDAVISAADKKLYEGKSGGRNKVVF